MLRSEQITGDEFTQVIFGHGLLQFMWTRSPI